MRAAGIAEERIYVDKRTGANMDREGLTVLLAFARPGDRINVLTLDRRPQHARDPQPRARPHPARHPPAYPRRQTRRRHQRARPRHSAPPAPAPPSRPAACRPGARRC
ncbi:hypothetical protein [Streptomyces capitiformicae]